MQNQSSMQNANIPQSRCLLRGSLPFARLHHQTNENESSQERRPHRRQVNMARCFSSSACQSPIQFPPCAFICIDTPPTHGAAKVSRCPPSAGGFSITSARFSSSYYALILHTCKSIASIRRISSNTVHECNNLFKH